LIFTQEVRLY